MPGQWAAELGQLYLEEGPGSGLRSQHQVSASGLLQGMKDLRAALASPTALTDSLLRLSVKAVGN